MGLNDAKSGFNSATEFMISGLPWVTSSIAVGTAVTGYRMPKVTKKIMLVNHETSAGKHIRIGFTYNGVVGGNYYKVDAGETVEFDVRVKDIYLIADNIADNPPYSLFVELTGIEPNMMPVLTGSVNGTTFWEGVG